MWWDIWLIKITVYISLVWVYIRQNSKLWWLGCGGGGKEWKWRCREIIKRGERKSLDVKKREKGIKRTVKRIKTIFVQSESQRRDDQNSQYMPCCCCLPCNHCSNCWRNFGLLVLGCVLRTAGNSIIWNYADPLTSLELLNYYLTLAMRSGRFCTLWHST